MTGATGRVGGAPIALLAKPARAVGGNGLRMAPAMLEGRLVEIIASAAKHGVAVDSKVAVRVEGVGKRFGSRPVLCDINLEVADGESIALLGPSGCGKTTLLRVLAGLEPISEGAVAIGGTSAAQARRRQEIGVAFQRPALIPSRTSLQNVELTLEICRRDRAFDPRKVLQDFGLGDFMGHYPHQLSGGMQQRVNIACALVHHPRLLLLDEPFGALDELTREAMWDWLSNILAVSLQTAVLVTHSVEEAVALSDRIVLMSPRPGRIHHVLEVRLARPRPARWEEAFLHETARIRRALYEAVNGGSAGS